jgi:hypothetical protein
MCKRKRMINMGFTDERFPAGTHRCLLYSNDHDRKKIVSGEKVASFADEIPQELVKTWIKEMGVEIILQCQKVHPYLIPHGQVVRNPYYMNAEDFLKEQALKRQRNEQ